MELMPGAAHAYLMVFGLFPFIIFGFVMSTFPRWMNGKEIPAQHYVTAFALPQQYNHGLYLATALRLAGLFHPLGVALPAGLLARARGWEAWLAGSGIYQICAQCSSHSDFRTGSALGWW